MKKILIITFCLLAINNLKAQKKDTKIVLTPFSEKTNKFKSTYDSRDYFFTKNNFKKGEGKMISLILFGKNQIENNEALYDRLLYHKFFLFCYINGKNVQIESQWYDKDPEDNINFENQNYIIRMKKNGAPFIYEDWQILVIDKSNFNSQKFTLYRYNSAWGE